MESINSSKRDVESQPLLGSDKHKSNFHKHVYGKRKTALLDTVALVVYLLHLIGMIFLSIFVFRRPIYDQTNSAEHEFRWFLFFAGITSIVSLLLSPFVLLLSYVNLVALIFWNSFLILAGSIGMIFSAFNFLTISYAIPICIICTFVIIWGGMVVYYSIKRRNTVSSNLKASASIVLHRPVSWIVNICTVVVNAVLLGYGLYLIHEILLRLEGWLGVLFSILSALSMSCNSIVISYIGYMTCSGSFASWYFSFNPNSEERYPHGTLKAFLRSISVSLGSIVIGSFLLSSVLVLRAILKLLKKSDSCGRKAHEKIAKYANEFTMIFVSLNGNSFMQASKEAKIIVEADSDATEWTDQLLIAHAIGFALTCTFVTLVISGLYYTEPDFYGMNRHLYFFLLSLAIMLCTGWLAWTSVAPQLAAVNTLFVCYTIDDTPFPHISPTVYNALKSTYQSAFRRIQVKKTTSNAR